MFVDLVKGILNHDGTRLYTREDLNECKETALKIMYRLWFLLYAESRHLLPVRDDRYAQMSLISIRNSLDGMEEKPDGHDCWDSVLGLFEGVRNGSPEHNPSAVQRRPVQARSADRRPYHAKQSFCGAPCAAWWSGTGSPSTIQA